MKYSLIAILIFFGLVCPKAEATWCDWATEQVANVIPYFFPKKAAARRLVQGLKEDVGDVKALRDKNIVLPSKNPDDDAKALIANQDPPEFLAAIGGLEMANPALRQQVEAKFFPRVEAELAKLSPEDRVGLLGWLSQSPLAQSHTGIKRPIAEFKKGDPLYDVLGASNEMRRFGSSVSNYALRKLVEENTPAAWDHIVADALTSEANTVPRRLMLEAADNPTMRDAFSRRVLSLQETRRQYELDVENAPAKDGKYGYDPKSHGSFTESAKHKLRMLDYEIGKALEFAQQIQKTITPDGELPRIGP